MSSQQKGLRGHLFEDQSVDLIKLKTSGYTPSDSYDLVNIQYFNTHTSSGQTYTAGNNISISGNVISYTGSTNSSLGYFIVDKFTYLSGNPIFIVTQNIGTLIGVEQRGVDLIPGDQFTVAQPSTVQILTGNTAVRFNDIFVIKYFTSTGVTIQQNVTNNYYSGGTYQAGNGIQITGNTIFYTGTTSSNYVGGIGINISGNIISYTGTTNYATPPTTASTSGTTVISGVTCTLATFDCQNLADSTFKITSDATNLAINLTNAPEGAYILIKLERTTISNINIYFVQDTYLQSNSQIINKGQSPLICRGHVGGNTVALLAIYRGTVNNVLSSFLKFTEDTQV